jgi:hypothetical protein
MKCTRVTYANAHRESVRDSKEALLIDPNDREGSESAKNALLAKRLEKN